MKIIFAFLIYVKSSSYLNVLAVPSTELEIHIIVREIIFT